MPLPVIVERQRLASPAITPQALAWDGQCLWMGSRDRRRIYAINRSSGQVVEETMVMGIPWSAVATHKTIHFTLGVGENDDRYIREYIPRKGFVEGNGIACPDFTGSYLSYDGESLYLSQWHKYRIVKLDTKGRVLRTIDIGAEICGHVFVNGWIYVLRGTEQNGEQWTIARFNLSEEAPHITDIAIVPFACRSLTYDGDCFWSNHRAANEIVSFAISD